MADSMRPAQTNGIAKEVEPANEAIEEAGTSSGPIPSEEPAKSDEGVTCGAEVNWTL